MVNKIRRYMNISLSKGQKLIILFVGIVAFVAQVLILTSVCYSREKNLTNQATIYAETIASSVKITINRSIDTTSVLKDLYMEYGDNFISDFNKICDRLSVSNKLISSLYIAPYAIIQQAWPNTVNDSTIGFEMLNDPEQGKSARLALDLESAVIAGPHKLIEGGVGFIIRDPLFIEEHFKLFIIAVLDFDNFISNIMVQTEKNNANYNFGIWKDSDNRIVTDSNGFFISNTTKSVSKKVSIPIEVPGDTWYISVEPVKGWFFSILSIHVIVLSIVGFFLIMIFVIVRQYDSAHKIYDIGHDRLTGLLSIGAFYTKVEKLFRENPDEEYDVMVADIENFKVANSLYGTQKCDEFLCFCAGILSESIPTGVCARLSGDQFIGILPSKDNRGLEYLQSVYDYIYNKGTIKGISVKFGFYGNVDKKIPINLICDRALNAARSVLHNYEKIVEDYNGELSKRHVREQMLESAFEKALENDEFKIWFQTKFDAVTEHVVGAEALVRWVLDDKTMVSPADFIYVFEEDGLIVRLDEYVFRKVCNFIKYWMLKGQKLIPISVNLSRVTLHHKGIIQKFRKIVDETDIPIELVPLEITESTSTNNKQIKELAEELKKAGFSIHMDDFGTGFSSLESLNILPFDEIKLDKSLIDFIGNPGGNELLRHTIELAHFKNLSVIAEGVETFEQLEFLRKNNCNKIQGYYFTAPLSYENTIAYLKDLQEKGKF